MANKGSSYERRIATEFSLWWSGGKNDAIFWRTSGSGARATTRGKRGKQTANHCGDLCASDPVGQPLIDMVAIEIKRGYPKATVNDLLDYPIGAAEQVYERWISQAERSRVNAQVPYWMIIHKRDQRYPLIVMPIHLLKELIHAGAGKPCPLVQLTTHLRRFVKRDGKVMVEIHKTKTAITTLAEFFKRVQPNHVREVIGEIDD